MHGDLGEVPLPHRLRPRILDGSQQGRHPRNLVAESILTLLPLDFRSTCDHVSLLVHRYKEGRSTPGEYVMLNPDRVEPCAEAR
jgi:hypothetical protein